MRVGGNFNCSCNNLKSLKGAPEYVGGDFDCSFNKIENINDLTTTYIGGDFYCYGNNVTDEDARILKEKGIVQGEIYYKDRMILKSSFSEAETLCLRKRRQIFWKRILNLKTMPQFALKKKNK